MQFNHAPAGVVWEIARNLPCRDQKSLRLTCSQLNLATESLVLRCVVIHISAKPPASTIHQLRTLAEEKTRVSEFTRKLKIESLKPTSSHENWTPRWLKYVLGPDGHDVEACMAKYLAKAISTLKHVESVAWTWNGDDLPWIVGPVMDAIASLPLMDDFQLAINGVNAAIPLDRLSGLRKIVVLGSLQPLVLGNLAQAIANSPYLSDLAIVPRSPTFSPCELFSKTPSVTSLPLRHLVVRASRLDLSPMILRHLNGLDSFDLEYTGSDPNVYLNLARGHLLCRRLIVGHVHPTLLDYLSQYSGTLQELSVLICDSEMRWEDSDALAERFWTTVLPKHAVTIRILNICPGFEGGWCYSDQAIHVLMQCKQLRSLSVTVDPEATGHVRLFQDNHFEHNYDQCAFDKIVSSIMDLSLTLPSLIHIHILIAKPQDFWPNRCYSHSLVAFLNCFVDQLVSNLTNYTLCYVRPDARPPEVIQVESRMCIPQRVDGGWKYELEAPICGLKPLCVRWRYADQRSRIGCNVCLRPP